MKEVHAVAESERVKGKIVEDVPEFADVVYDGEVLEAGGIVVVAVARSGLLVVFRCAGFRGNAAEVRGFGAVLAVVVEVPAVN